MRIEPPATDRVVDLGSSSSIQPALPSSAAQSCDRGFHARSASITVRRSNPPAHCARKILGYLRRGMPGALSWEARWRQRARLRSKKRSRKNRNAGPVLSTYAVISCAGRSDHMPNLNRGFWLEVVCTVRR